MQCYIEWDAPCRYGGHDPIAQNWRSDAIVEVAGIAPLVQLGSSAISSEVESKAELAGSVTAVV
jgi:hypothetical protein